MKHAISKFAGLAVAVSVALGSSLALAAGGGDGEPAHYPIKKPREQSWSFAGPFGTWDLGQMQRGFKVYQEVCSACHNIDLVKFRNLTALGFSEAQAKAIAAEYEVEDGPDADGEFFDRTAVLSDGIPGPYTNSAEAAAANNGAAPPDFSLLAKARAPERGFPTFIFDVFTLYAENGSDYIYSLLTGYQDPPSGVEVPDGAHYNPYFIAGSALAMANPLSDDIVDYDDGTPQTVDQYSKDVAAFMMWAAEPTLVERKQLGFKVMIFLLIFAGLLYLTKKRVFRDLKEA
ncbi:MAG: cytochrome c1 [Rhizobiaceae bacterium]